MTLSFGLKRLMGNSEQKQSEDDLYYIQAIIKLGLLSLSTYSNGSLQPDSQCNGT